MQKLDILELASKNEWPGCQKLKNQKGLWIHFQKLCSSFFYACGLWRYIWLLFLFWCTYFYLKHHNLQSLANKSVAISNKWMLPIQGTKVYSPLCVCMSQRIPMSTKVDLVSSKGILQIVKDFYVSCAHVLGRKCMSAHVPPFDLSSLYCIFKCARDTTYTIIYPQ